MTSLYLFSLTPIKDKEFKNPSAKLLLGQQAQTQPACCWGESQHSCFLPTAPTSQEQLGKIWGMLSLSPLQKGELCLGKGHDGCLGKATAPVWPSTATRFFRTHVLGMAPQPRGSERQKHMEDRHFI